MEDFTFMGETLTIFFHCREEGTFELQVKESWSGRTVIGNFVPPYTQKQLNTLLKKLNTLQTSDQELREIGLRLFLAICGAEIPGAMRSAASEQSVQAMLRSVIQRTLKRRGTVALTFCFGPGCEEFVRYPWELLYNGDHFLLVSGIFTLTRALLRPDVPAGCELPVHPPFRVLYIGASPVDCAPLEVERSFEALEQALCPLIDSGHIFLDRLEPPTFDQLVRYLNSMGGAGMLDDSDTTIPCYVVHFDGHGAYGRLCPKDECETVNEPDARKCSSCGTSLQRVKPQTYLCFCDAEGCNRFIDTQSLRDLFLSSDVRLTVFSACETATMNCQDTRQSQTRHTVVDATLATALVTGQVPAVVAMPFSLQDDLSPTFVFHFYEALAEGRTLEEGLSRARQAMLPMQQKSWFIPVLYRHVGEDDEGPVPLLADRDSVDENDHPLAHLGATETFVGRNNELQELDELLSVAVSGNSSPGARGSLRIRPGTHHVALTGSAGIGKSALAYEVVRRNREKFSGGIIGVSLQAGKSFGDALMEMINHLHIPKNMISSADLKQRARLVQGALRSLASRELPCLLLLDSFEEVDNRTELQLWLQFLSTLPQEIVVLVTSRSNPETMMVLEGPHCRWYEYPVGKMNDDDLLHLFAELAGESGLDQRIHLEDVRQQEILREICVLLDGYPLGAELIFGTARTIGGRVYTPEAATRSLEEVRDELRSNPLAGILAVLEVSYNRLTPMARLLLSYLAAFKLPFSREQILTVVAPENLSSCTTTVPLTSEVGSVQGELVSPAQLVEHWRAARDELVQASFIQFDGRVYTIHPQVRYFALSHLPLEERRRVHRVVAAYYAHLPQPSPDEWFASFEHLESASEPQDLQEAVRIAVRASWALCGRGHAVPLLAMLRRASMHASRLGDITGEGQVQCCLGAVLRSQGQYTEAEAYLRSSLEFHRKQQNREDAGWALYELAMLCREVGNFKQAGIHAQEALTLFREVNNTRGEAWMQIVLGEVSRGYGAYYDALGHFELALTATRTLNDKEGVAVILRDRGTVYEALGQYSKALSDYDEALRIFQDMDMGAGQAWVMADKSIVLTNQGKLAQAEALCSEALSMLKMQGIRRGEAWAMRAMGDIMREQRDLPTARTYYDEALARFASLGDRVDEARVHCALGAIAFEENDYLVARERYELAQSMALEQGARQISGRALRGLGDVARILHQFDEAERLYQEAAERAVQLDTPAEHCAVLRRLGLLYCAQEHYSRALECWVQALALDQRLGHPTRNELQKRVHQLMQEHSLQDCYEKLCERHHIPFPASLL